MMTPTLSGKSIIITGASRGIGRAIAEACASDGAMVGVNYRQSESAAKQLQSRFPENVELLPFDVANFEASRKAVQSFIQRHTTLDVLVNNAGIIRPHLLMAQRDLSKAIEEFQVNTFGTMSCTQIVLPHMVKGGGGTIVNLSSCAVVLPAIGQGSYAASKAAVEAYTRAVAVEYGKKGIRCFCLRLGPVDTDMLRETVGETGMVTTMPQHTLIGRLLSPSEIAETVRNLLLSSNALVTGSTIDLSAGYSLK